MRSVKQQTSHKNQSKVFHTNSDGELFVEHKNDVTGILKANQYQRTSNDLHHKSETFNHVARIDSLAVINWMGGRGITHDAWRIFMQDEDGTFLRDFLNDPDNKKWRTREGKV